MDHTPWQETTVKKSTGFVEQFDPEKVKQSVIKAGAREDLANDVVQDIERTTHSGMTTSEIDSDIQYILKRRDESAYENWMLWKEEHQKM